MAKESNTAGRMVWLVGLPVVAFVFVAAAFAWLLFGGEKEQTLRLGAGRINSESYEIASAIAMVTRRFDPNIRIKVVPTGGSSEAIQLLSEGKLDLATSQSDAITRRDLRLVAMLYPDLYQLVVRSDSGIEKIKDLEGKRVALPPITSGQYRAFWFLANQYGLAPEAIDAIPMSDRLSKEAIREGKVDAIFRVRGARTQEIKILVTQAPVRLLPIDQGKAIHLRQTALRAAIIPKGSYRGWPPLPENDLPTVAVDRILLANKSVDAELIRKITSVLFEKRRDLVQAAPLAGFIRQPDIQGGTLLPVHEGALSYYDREKPSVFEEKAEFFGFLVSIIVVLGSVLLWLKRYLADNKKGRIEDYNSELIELERKARDVHSISELNVHKDRLMEILAEVVDDMNHKRINSEGMQFFAFTWEAVNATIQDHEEQLRLGSKVAGGSVRGGEAAS